MTRCCSSRLALSSVASVTAWPLQEKLSGLARAQLSTRRSEAAGYRRLCCSPRLYGRDRSHKQSPLLPSICISGVPMAHQGCTPGYSSALGALRVEPPSPTSTTFRHVDGEKDGLPYGCHATSLTSAMAHVPRVSMQHKPVRRRSCTCRRGCTSRRTRLRRRSLHLPCAVRPRGGRTAVWPMAGRDPRH